jgi:hypothetical protein
MMIKRREPPDHTAARTVFGAPERAESYVSSSASEMRL